MDSSELVDLYGHASAWANEQVEGLATDLDQPTPCDGWDVRTLLNHLLETQRYFTASARGDEDAKPPSQDPPDLLGDDPVRDFEDARADALRTFAQPGVAEQMGVALGIAFSDQLLHGWDLAVAGTQDTTMPDGLPEVALEMIHGQFTDEQRAGVFGPEIAVPDGASAQDELLAYTGRDPAR